MSSKSRRTLLLTLSVFVLSLPSAPLTAKTIYVDDDAAGANDGTSWDNAYVYLQDALGAAVGGDEIRVAQGIYKPDLGGGNTPGNRRATFQLVHNTIIKGGFAGVGESDADVRDVEAYETILSGDLNGDDVTVANPEDLQDEPTRAENSYNVVTGNSIGEITALDGLVITGGNDNTPFKSGGGMDNSNSSPTLTDCTFRLNFSRHGGGGMANSRNSSPTLINCTFSGNSTAQYGNGGGMSNDESRPILTDCAFTGNWGGGSGGMYNRQSSPTLTNCIFSENSGTHSGGMYNSQSNPTLTDCTFSENWANNGGGGMCNRQSDPTLIDCTFRANWATEDGGGMYNRQSNPTLTRCIFRRNSANSGGGMENGPESSPTLTDCTFSGNSANSGGGTHNWRSSPALTNCTFSGNSAEYGGGMSNLENHPTFSGGGMSNSDNNHPILINCTFSGNSAKHGAGMNNFESNTTLTNCTFGQNSAENGNALRCVSLIEAPSKAELINCILWDGGNEIWNIDNYSTIVITYSNVESGFPGEGNIDADPLFADPGYWDPNGTPADVNDDFWVDGDYHLKSQVGRFDPNTQTWFVDDVTSPCIDAGDPNSDWISETWPRGGRINMGAYGGTREASMSTQPEAMALPRIAYIYSSDAEAAGSFQSLLVRYGCPTTLIRLVDVSATPLDAYDLVIVANDTQYEDAWSDPNTVAAIQDSGKPVVGLGDGGYDFFGLLGLSVGYPNGGHGSRNSIEVIDPDSGLYRTPYSIEIPADGTLRLYTETNHVGLYLWPTIPETVTVLGREVNDVCYYPLAMEYSRYLLWGFNESPHKMTEVGKRLFINVVIRAANAAWEVEIY